jgi:hypothetical protein
MNLRGDGSVLDALTRDMEFKQANVPGDPGLPRGMGDADCDGKDDPWADAGARRLWQACEPGQQEEIAQRFALTRADDVRDALLAAEDSGVSEPTGGAAERFGRALWGIWSRYRDHCVEALQSGGRLGTDSSILNFEESPCQSRP